ncbi:hypothetical protein M406DRAFT_33644 [Cryphonectria parasitica EP155]|uniref:Nuclear pore complex component n=1 Tax=Cryphonectria parasitica (strain ATCC 38755 / EP155) TaxID=660469 RepID=A0A9P4YDL0_CRYP1|nr:uncharacterized protein M406DRAFT_33644 [Cryphonectria parasitica EP155]KAF3770685.1 hypothetical protein M406DRAFT_33644 [Cryphonectria parasitica EP155]
MSGSSTALAVSKPRFNVTPSKTTPSKAIPPATESPGNWQHPRIDEITRRQSATLFTSDNVKTVIYNVTALFVVGFVHRIHDDFSSRWMTAVWWAFFAFYMLPLWNILVACLPLLREKDDLSDIPLTPAQRKLLGLPPSSKPPAPDTVYSTPPRCSRTPSIASSTGKASPNNSPLSANGSPGSGSRIGGSPYSPVVSPLLQKAVGYNGRRSTSQGSPTPLSQSLLNQSAASFNSSVFSEPPATPSPPGGKRISVGLNNKWLYERSRRSSNNVWS